MLMLSSHISYFPLSVPNPFYLCFLLRTGICFLVQPVAPASLSASFACISPPTEAIAHGHQVPEGQEVILWEGVQGNELYLQPCCS